MPSPSKPSSAELFRPWARGLMFVGYAVLAAQCASASPPSPAATVPTEVKIISVPPPPAPQPTDVRVISVPTPSPAEIRILSAPKDDSALNLAKATWGLLAATAFLAAATVFSSWWQGRDTKRRDRSAMLREANRIGHKVVAEASRVDQVARLIPAARNQLHLLLQQGGQPTETRDESEAILAQRRAALKSMIDEALLSVPAEPDAKSPLLPLSDTELTARLWRLDALQAKLDEIHDAVDQELAWYQSEVVTLRQQRTALQAASIAAPRPPLKTRLGD